MSYIDGFLLPVPKKQLKAYQKMSKKAGKIWREHGALDYKECVSDDIDAKGFAPFSKSAKAKTGDVVVFSYIVYRSKAHRNTVNKKVMNDRRLKDLCNPKALPFDVKRMAYGGFKVFVSE